jgi:hypothetical protein
MSGRRRISIANKLRYRLWGLPRRASEFDAVSLHLATLRRVGWMRSVAGGLPVDRSGAPIPWWTYAAISWLDSVLRGSEEVLEFGAGHSSLWLASRTARVTSIEHDRGWADRVARRSPANLRVEHRACAGDLLETKDDDPYVEPLRSGSSRYDVVVVDGMARITCLRGAPSVLKDDGLVVLDNADRVELRAGLEALEARGFGRLDLVGPVPGGTNFSCTSVLTTELGGRWGRPVRPPVWWGSEIPDFEVL